MRNIGQILSVEICDYSNIKNVSIKNEQLHLIIRGENFYKNYVNIKGINYEINEKNKTLHILFDVNDINKSTFKKHIDIMNIMAEHLDKKNNICFWNKIHEHKQNFNNITQLNKYEKCVNYSSHLLYKSNNIKIDQNYLICTTNDQVKILKNNLKYELTKKSLGGIIFDDSFSFLVDFNEISKTQLKKQNIVITDTLPKYKIKNYEFITHDLVNLSTNLTQKRIFLYYPTEQIINKIIYDIKQGLKPPLHIWLIFPKNIEMLDFKKIITLLFWSQIELSCYGGLNITSLNYNNCINRVSNENVTKKSISIERIKYDLSIFEKYLIKSNDDIIILDKLYFTTITQCVPTTIYDSISCPICAKEFDETLEMSKSHFQCGHIFCPQCIFETFRTTDICPICRTNCKKNPVIQKLSLTKANYLKKLLSKLLVNIESNILIYVDDLTIAKGLLNWIKINFIGISVNIPNKKKIHFKKSIIVCPKKLYFICKDIKNINEIITIATNNDFIVNTEALGYNYYFSNFKIRLWIFDYELVN